MTENIEAIVLGYTKFGENSVVVHTLSEAYGRRGFLVRIGKKAGMALLLPMNILEMGERPPERHPEQPLQEHDESVPVRGAPARRQGRAGGGRPVPLVRPQHPDPGQPGQRFLQLPHPVPAGIRRDDIAPFAEKHLVQLKPFLTATFSESMLLPLRGEERNALCEDLLRYLEYHTESSINVRSLAVLREVFA